MELRDVVMKLVGPVDAVGETYQDAQRFENLKTLTDLVDRLLYVIDHAASSATREEASMKKIGMYAKNFIDTMRQM